MYTLYTVDYNNVTTFIIYNDNNKHTYTQDLFDEFPSS